MDKNLYFDQILEWIIKNIQEPVVFFAHLNGKESTVNRALGGSTYPGKKPVRPSLCKIILVVMKHSNLYLGLVLPSGGWQSLIVYAPHV